MNRERTYYVYTHEKEDGEIFYVGRGTVYDYRKIHTHRLKYERAFARAKRSPFWKNVAAGHKCIVKILFVSNDENLIKNKEKDLIELYGRRDFGTGTLVNHTEGGEDTGVNCPKSRNIPINQYTKNGDFVKRWNQPMHIENELCILRTNVLKCCRGKQKTAYGYIWRYADKIPVTKIKPLLIPEEE